MSNRIARGVMALALASFSEDRHEWTAAMAAEFHIATEAGRGLSFSIGCLAAGWREMPMRWEGRFRLTSYAVALGLIVPMAAMQIIAALVGYHYVLPSPDRLESTLFTSAYQGVIPALALVMIVLAAGHLAIAWQLLERRWRAVALLWSLNAAATITLVLVGTVLFVDVTVICRPLMALVAELALIPALAWWQGQLPRPHACAEQH
ncbi:hypothetical protein ACU5AX_13100 [Sphingomonas sp. XXL09]|uniref:hypothetical protein n=1 Tax=Sphingomonas sp. XXL09 TaxID=3457787 RepID=UPI00406BA8BE